MTVQISASWTKDDRHLNGLEAIRKELISDPLQRRYCVALVETKRITRDIGDGDVEYPTIRVVHIEPVDGASEHDARTLLEEAYKERSGHEVEPSLFDGGPAGDAVDEG